MSGEGPAKQGISGQQVIFEPLARLGAEGRRNLPRRRPMPGPWRLPHSSALENRGNGKAGDEGREHAGV